MAVNVLGGIKTHYLGRKMDLPVVWAWVQSHHMSGRFVWFTTADHRHDCYDRLTDEFYADPPIIDDTCRRPSCLVLFSGQPSNDDVMTRARELRCRLHKKGDND